MVKIHISRMECESWTEALFSEATISPGAGLFACSSPSLFTSLFDVLIPHTPNILPLVLGKHITT
jgi:hypothetical protein